MRESPDLFSGSMFVPDKKLPINNIHVLLHRHVSVVAHCFLMKLDGIVRGMMDSYETTL